MFFAKFLFQLIMLTICENEWFSIFWCFINNVFQLNFLWEYQNHVCVVVLIVSFDCLNVGSASQFSIRIYIEIYKQTYHKYLINHKLVYSTWIIIINCKLTQQKANVHETEFTPQSIFVLLSPKFSIKNSYEP